MGATVTKGLSQLQRCPWSWAPLLWPWCKRPGTGGLGAGPQHLPLMCPLPPETQNAKLAGSSFWLLASCPLALINDFSHGRMDGPSSLPAPWTLLIPLASRYKGVSAPASLPMTDRRLQINIPISSPPGGGGPFGAGYWNASHKVQVESTPPAHGINLSDMLFLLPRPSLPSPYPAPRDYLQNKVSDLYPSLVSDSALIDTVAVFRS